MKDYTMDLAKIAAGIVTDCLGNSLKSKTYYSSDGNSIIMEFDGYPLYNSTRTDKVFVQFPRSTFYMRKGDFHYHEIQQAQCRFYQERLGNRFEHPHVFNDGHPCWWNGKRERVVDFITNIIETFSVQNVTTVSVTEGHLASGIMGFGPEVHNNARSQQKKVMEVLKCKPFISDHRKLETYVNKRWCSKITMLNNSI